MLVWNGRNSMLLPITREREKNIRFWTDKKMKMFPIESSTLNEMRRFVRSEHIKETQASWRNTGPRKWTTQGQNLMQCLNLILYSYCRLEYHTIIEQGMRNHVKQLWTNIQNHRCSRTHAHNHTIRMLHIDTQYACFTLLRLHNALSLSILSRRWRIRDLTCN